MSYVEKRLKKRLSDPAFKSAWEETELEYQIARNIINKRKSLGLTQQELAELTNKQQSVISRIESGDCNVTIKTLAEIATALGTSVSDITTEHLSE